MNTPSPEAKQAAKYSIREVNGTKHLFRYDEDRGLPNNAELQFWYELQEASVATAKLRKELENWKERAEGRKQVIGSQERDIAKLRLELLRMSESQTQWRELAHQQPSAPYKHEYADHLPSKDVSDISAPAPSLPDVASERSRDVEKIIDGALDNAIAALGQCQKGTARQFLRSALAQARAPLVEALEFYADSENWVNDVLGMPDGYSSEVKGSSEINQDGGMRARAALIGTEKKP